MRRFRAFVLAVTLSVAAFAQVHSPKVLLKSQPDASDLQRLAQGIYANAGARTPRERAEAVWRFFLTDGRFVTPGFWYHIAGWTYEEPMGEVLDPLKLLNSYGFGLCYHIAPVLEAVWKAGGFADARVWFLTGHTVAEVYYDGAYHYYDSDMMGYNIIGRGPVKQSPVASVHQIEENAYIVLAKLKSPTQVDTAAVEAPWYPADVRAAAIGDLASLFSTTADNWLFPFERAPQGHSMSFELRRASASFATFNRSVTTSSTCPTSSPDAPGRSFHRRSRSIKLRPRMARAARKTSAAGRPAASSIVFRSPEKPARSIESKART